MYIALLVQNFRWRSNVKTKVSFINISDDVSHGGDSLAQLSICGRNRVDEGGVYVVMCRIGEGVGVLTWCCIRRCAA